MSVRIRGIYATALTQFCDDVVQASPPIRERFDDSFPVAPADVTVETTSDRQGVGIHGDAERAADLADRLRTVGRDALAWPAALPRGGVYAGEVTETLGGGAVVDCGDAEGFLPYSKTARHVETGDSLRVQVVDPRPPWTDGRPVLDTTVRVTGHLVTLVRGGTADPDGPELADIVPADPPDGWAPDWGRDADDASLEALGAAVTGAGERAERLDAALTDAAPPADAAPAPYWTGEATHWVWFGREARFALDDHRREVTPTMTGHHRTKAATDAASTAVDFVEAVCPDAGEEFPFDAVTAQFGPAEGDRLAIGHGKPDGRYIDLGPATVQRVAADGEVVLRRELSGGGTYDALGVPIEAGDVATTKLKEGRWWYPTVYRSSDGETRGTYVNVCTPVEVFPREARYVDLHVDVVKHADGTVERVDDDELDAAEARGDVPDGLAAKARTVAEAVSNAL